MNAAPGGSAAAATTAPPYSKSELEALIAALDEQLRMLSPDAQLPLVQLKAKLRGQPKGAALTPVEAALKNVDCEGAQHALQVLTERLTPTTHSKPTFSQSAP